MNIVVAGKERAGEIAALADEIWREHFTDIIGAGQVNYMLGLFQSQAAISRYIDDGYIYCLFETDGIAAGYMGYKTEADKIFLSKLYVRAENRRTGIASEAIKHLAAEAKDAGLSAIWLTVNRNNREAVSAYKSMGFYIISSRVNDIGGGYVMDDYVMEKQIPKP